MDYTVNKKYKEIFKLDKLLAAAKIPRIVSRCYNGWIIHMIDKKGREIGDAVEHCFSYGSPNDLLEVYGFGLKEPAGFLTADEAFKYFEDAWRKL